MLISIRESRDDEGESFLRGRTDGKAMHFSRRVSARREAEAEWIFSWELMRGMADRGSRIAAWREMHYRFLEPLKPSTTRYGCSGRNDLER